MKNILKNINVLHSFECAARHNSYSKAAVELCISQAAVSQQMRQLEENLGSQLFLRKGKQMLLTQKGKALFETSQQAFSLLNKSLSKIIGEGISGSLTITSTQAFTSIWLMPRLHRFSALYPDIKVRVLSSPSFDDLKQEHIDIAIRFGTQVKENTDKTFVCEYFGEDFVYPVCSDKLAKTINFQVPGDFFQTWLVSLEKTNPYDWPSWFENMGIKDYQEHQQWTHVHSTDMALSAVLSGHGITLAARYLCAEQLESGQLIIPIKIAHPLTVKRYLVFDADSSKIARLNVFKDWLKIEMG